MADGAREWGRDGWTARVVASSEPDGGWAVEMWRDGDSEAVLVGPWTMGRDKKNPKPLDAGAFTTLLKTAKDVMARHAQHARDRLHRHFEYDRADGQRVEVDLDAAGDDDDPHAILTAKDARTGEPLGGGRTPASFRLTAAAIERFLAGQ